MHKQRDPEISGIADDTACSNDNHVFFIFKDAAKKQKFCRRPQKQDSKIPCRSSKILELEPFAFYLAGLKAVASDKKPSTPPTSKNECASPSILKKGSIKNGVIKSVRESVEIYKESAF